MQKLIFSLLLFPILSFAQKGIEFEHSLSWKQILEKAQKENKYVFVDAFATWCGPCKYMAANVFTKDQVGEMFNNNFINVKVQIDTTAKDNENVKRWYADAHALSNEYNVRVYPTYLFFNPQGKLVHRVVGSMEADEFALKAKNALNEDGQYYTMLNKYHSGNRDPEFLKKLTYAADGAYDAANVKAISKDYLATQKELMTDDNINFINRFTQSSNDAGFRILIENENKLNHAKGNRAATDKILEIIKQEEINPSLKKKSSLPDWKLMTATITRKYPRHAQEAIAGSKVVYYQSKGDWINFQSAVQQYMKQYGSSATPDQLNSFAWAVFENCKDMTCVKDALDWSKRSFAEKDNAAFIDTYANILYKMGKKDEAINWEEKAMSLADDNDKSDYKTAIDKMQKGEKTWKE